MQRTVADAEDSITVLYVIEIKKAANLLGNILKSIIARALPEKYSYLSFLESALIFQILCPLFVILCKRLTTLLQERSLLTG